MAPASVAGQLLLQQLVDLPRKPVSACWCNVSVPWDMRGAQYFSLSPRRCG